MDTIIQKLYLFTCCISEYFATFRVGSEYSQALYCSRLVFVLWGGGFEFLSIRHLQHITNKSKISQYSTVKNEVKHNI